MLMLFGVFFSCLFLYYNDFIQHTDEFHQWAAAVKYMLEKDKLPDRSRFYWRIRTKLFCIQSVLFCFFKSLVAIMSKICM